MVSIYVCYNNPVFFIDPDGMLATYDWDAHNSGRKGVYKEVSFGEAMASHGINGNKNSSPKQEQYKNGDYVAVVNAPKGAGGFGHNALLVGNDDAGWVFISKEGRDEDENSNSGNNPLTGGRALDARKESFATINDFFADRDYSEYKEGLVIKIQSSTAEKGEKEMTKQALSKYSLIFNNCGQAVNETLNKFGIRTVDPDKYKVYGGYSAGAALYNGVVPNEMYYSVKQANKNVPRTILSRK
ncbi:hypothetical protein NJT12_15845 [Flavobacterium sp. AC]|uniref:Uncharacterized protein n=1 Tax=Flavobacterium azizsancarii TaxID=2961580 RepID=A0ABT4WEV3_9FLAO|nr:hypothetical protein [Flavobacterium azizsancarii]MDA6071088.1 hypothetical protein [Flavobacterium azizsancarii]